LRKGKKPSLNQEWEDTCRRCGRCCYEKVEFEGEVYYTDVPCEKLDPETNLCTVYENRHEARPGCTPLNAQNIRQGILPADCPYVSGIRDYPEPHLQDQEDEEP
jgi:uncharacterized cysteine cluster protein YcgN (CxxCxxCC family)